mmetsp:Transcript_24932/g.56888  ORF Transcript_24932/g.56888 Transcript_24932/m.56888 type:complete len:150 (-) Transcript_24932:138-587(-)
MKLMKKVKSIRSPFKARKGNKKDTVPPTIVTSDDDPVMEDREDREEECASPVDRSPTNERYTTEKEDFEESSVISEDNALSTVREEPSVEDMEDEERTEGGESKEVKADFVVPTEATATSDKTTLDAIASATKFSLEQIPLNFCGCFDE